MEDKICAWNDVNDRETAKTSRTFALIIQIFAS